MAGLRRRESAEAVTAVLVALKRAYRFLVSSRVALWLMISWLALVLVWVVPFILTGQPEQTVSAIGQEWLPFRIVYASLAVVSILCAILTFWSVQLAPTSYHLFRDLSGTMQMSRPQ